MFEVGLQEEEGAGVEPVDAGGGYRVGDVGDGLRVVDVEVQGVLQGDPEFSQA